MLYFICHYVIYTLYGAKCDEREKSQVQVHDDPRACLHHLYFLSFVLLFPSQSVGNNSLENKNQYERRTCKSRY